MAVESRAFPLIVYDPRKGQTVRERLDLKGNPNINDDWAQDVKTKEPITFVDFARGEGRFAKHFDRQGNASAMIQDVAQERLANWRMLQDLAGLRQPQAAAAPAAAAAGGSKAADRIAQAKAAAAAKAGTNGDAPKPAAPAAPAVSSAAADRIAQAKARAAAKKAGGE
jgi:hypothetical protein